MQALLRSMAGAMSREQLGWELGWTMIYFVLAGAVLWGFAALLRRAMRPFSPQARYAASLCCLIALALLAPMSFFAVRTYPESLMLLRPELQPASLYTPTGDAVGIESPFTRNAASAVSRAAPGDRLAAAWSEFRAALMDEKLEPIVSAILPRLPWIWLVGSSLMLIYFSLGLMGADRLRRECDSLEQDELGGLLNRLRREMGVSRRVLIGMSDRVAAPLVLGVMRPMILLPMSVVSSLSVDQLEFVLLHELAHVRRHDNLINLFQRFVEAIAFFHPAAWRISAWVRLERELCCDAAVLSRRSSPSAYAETLASLAMPGISAPYAVASLANHQLVSRVRHIMQAKEPSMRFSSKWFVATAMALLASGGFVAAFAQQPEKPEAAKTEEKPQAGEAITIEVKVGEDGVLQLQAAPNASYASVAELLKSVAGTLEKEGKHPQIKVKSKNQEKSWTAWTAANCQSCHEGPFHQAVVAHADATFKLNDTCEPGVAQWLKSTAEVKPATQELQLEGVFSAIALADESKINQSVISDVPVATQEFTLQAERFLALDNTVPAWSFKQAAGPPNTFVLGDQSTAWASKTPDGQGEWLFLSYEAPVEINAVLIHETFNPGAVSRVDAILPDNEVIVLWSGEPQAVKTDSPRLFLCKPKKAVKAAKIRVTIASDVVQGWNEIDAVGILDAEGKVHWAKDAAASSSYSDAAGSGATSEVKAGQWLGDKLAVRQADRLLRWRAHEVEAKERDPVTLEIKEKKSDPPTSINVNDRKGTVEMVLGLESAPRKDAGAVLGLQLLGDRVASVASDQPAAKSDGEKLKGLETELELLQKQLDALRSKLKSK